MGDKSGSRRNQGFGPIGIQNDQWAGFPGVGKTDAPSSNDPGFDLGYDAGRSDPYRVSHRMNVGNVRALRRSMRRVQAFAKLAHRTISFVHQHKLKKHRRK
jgi:hypothetical protein